jgi:putative methionine-R-sulfoxide reductase with GAF domain
MFKTACDGETQSEIVIPLVVPTGTTDRQTPDFKVIGVFDLDSTITRNFDNDDLEGLKGILKILALGCDWN